MPTQPRFNRDHLLTIARKIIRDFVYGYQPKMDDRKPVTGQTDEDRYENALARVKEIKASASRFKIGISGNVEGRMDYTDRRGKFKHFSLVYKTKRRELAKAVEVDLVKHFRRHNLQGKNENISEELATRLRSIDGYYWIYVVYDPAKHQ